MQGKHWQGTAHLDVSEIVDQESFKAWLEALPEEGRFKTAIMLAARAVVRVFPFWAANMAEALTENRIDLTVVPVARNALIGGVAVTALTPQIRSAAAAARKATVGAPQGIKFSELGEVAVSAAADIAEAVSQTNAEWALGSAQYAACYAGCPEPFSAMWSDLQRDIRALAKHSDIRTLPLWPGDMPPEIADAWTKGRAWMEAAPGHAFWIRWYDAILAGRPLTQDWDSHWQLMHDIALIPDEQWGEGKEQDAIRVAGIIDLITQKHALQQEVARAKRALENETYNAMTLGQHRDNLPDDMPSSRIVEYRAALKELQAELDAVEEALEPPVPDAEVLEQATGRLRAVWEKVRKAIIALVAAYALGAAGYLGSVHIESLQTLIAEKLPGFVQSLKNVGSKPSALPTEQSSWGNSPLDL